MVRVREGEQNVNASKTYICSYGLFLVLICFLMLKCREHVTLILRRDIPKCLNKSHSCLVFEVPVSPTLIIVQFT